MFILVTFNSEFSSNFISTRLENLSNAPLPISKSVNLDVNLIKVFTNKSQYHQ